MFLKIGFSNKYSKSSEISVKGSAFSKDANWRPAVSLKIDFFADIFQELYFSGEVSFKVFLYNIFEL